MALCQDSALGKDKPGFVSLADHSAITHQQNFSSAAAVGRSRVTLPSPLPPWSLLWATSGAFTVPSSGNAAENQQHCNIQMSNPRLALVVLQRTLGFWEAVRRLVLVCVFPGEKKPQPFVMRLHLGK